MALFDSIFRRPRKYDEDFRVRRFYSELDGYDDNWISPQYYNLELISVTYQLRTQAGIRNAECSTQIRVFDAQHCIAQSIPYTIISSVTYTFHNHQMTYAPARNLAGALAYAHFPPGIHMLPGWRINFFVNFPLSGDTYDWCNIIAKTWEL